MLRFFRLQGHSAQSKDKLKCSIAFVFFAGEEQGLNGSKYFVSHVPSPIHDIQYMFIFDCIGFGDSIQINWGKSFPDLWNICKEIDQKNDKLLVYETSEGGSADADPFFRKGIKTLNFVSTNSYKHLHQITDTPETINKTLLIAITKLGYKTHSVFNFNPLYPLRRTSLKRCTNLNPEIHKQGRKCYPVGIVLPNNCRRTNSKRAESPAIKNFLNH
jgi:Zn-dependent M28 family amino/carboxypeptidase